MRKLVEIGGSYPVVRQLREGITGVKISNKVRNSIMYISNFTLALQEKTKEQVGQRQKHPISSARRLFEHESPGRELCEPRPHKHSQNREPVALCHGVRHSGSIGNWLAMILSRKSLARKRSNLSIVCLTAVIQEGSKLFRER